MPSLFSSFFKGKGVIFMRFSDGTGSLMCIQTPSVFGRSSSNLGGSLVADLIDSYEVLVLVGHELIFVLISFVPTPKYCWIAANPSMQYLIKNGLSFWGIYFLGCQGAWCWIAILDRIVKWMKIYTLKSYMIDLIAICLSSCSFVLGSHSILDIGSNLRWCINRLENKLAGNVCLQTLELVFISPIAQLHIFFKYFRIFWNSCPLIFCK